MGEKGAHVQKLCLIKVWVKQAKQGLTKKVKFDHLKSSQQLISNYRSRRYLSNNIRFIENRVRMWKICSFEDGK